MKSVTTMQAAGVGKRFLAGLIDISLINGVSGMLVTMIAAKGTSNSKWLGGLSYSETVMLWLLTAVVYGFYCVCFEVSRWHATPGKKLLNLIVQNKKGEPVSVLRSLWRYSMLLLSFIVMLFVLIAFISGLVLPVEAVDKLWGQDSKVPQIIFLIYFLLALPACLSKGKPFVYDFLSGTEVVEIKNSHGND